MNMYKRVILESLDGCGKTTLYNHLVKNQGFIPGGKYPTDCNDISYFFNKYAKQLYDNIDNFYTYINTYDHCSDTLYTYLERIEDVLYNIIKNLENIMYLNINDQMYPLPLDIVNNEFRGKRNAIQDRGIISTFIYNYLELVYWKTYLKKFQKNKMKKAECDIIYYLLCELKDECLMDIDLNMANIWTDFDIILRYKSPFNNVFKSDKFIVLICNEAYRRSYIKEKVKSSNEEPYKRYFESDEVNERLGRYIDAFKSMVIDLKDDKDKNDDRLIKLDQINFIKVDHIQYNYNDKYHYNRRDIVDISCDILNIIEEKENNNEEE